ncbi:MAG TPA: hypothetical protein VF160_00565 [Candidatus Dormibacteraeota bacterium]
MSEPRDRLEERLDQAFASIRPRRGFEDELWTRIQARRSPWARFLESARRVQLGPALGGLAVLLVVVVAGGLLLQHGGPHASSAGSAAEGPTRTAPNAAQPNGAAGADVVTFGPLPPPPQPTGGYAGPVNVTAVTASVAVPARLPVTRYREWSAAQADAYAAGLNAQPAGPVPAGALGRYAGKDFTLVLYPTDTAAGTEPRVVITPAPGALRAAGSDDAAITTAVTDYLSRFNVAPGGGAQSPSVARSGGQVLVRWALSPLRQGWLVTLGADLSILMAEAPLPLSPEVAFYATPTSTKQVFFGGPSGGPNVVLDTAELVYVVASDGTYGYFEPAILYSGRFTQGGVTYQKQVLLPAVH